MMYCPFCGGVIKIGVTDMSGNLRDKEYEFDNKRGCLFVPIHNIGMFKDCPIASHEDEIMGTKLYDTREELMQSFERRGE